ncbi:hypothetical protein QE364_001630 [Nocardioides zeae]|uniref:Uncharacterized protein n=2 Tax=Nocardioides zeae TaxID=1457234 RepID=A0AAJ1U141_9ACTN|nr:hypothetical protein [Nocardioides zeae]MDQ1103348.1 hypothetical protein [Nocardioides zeae]MDR6172929.1 hypothetical protein [Nocardioides zeae]MDR6209923.1 hypothetical protein [Nocardioides zeae]
MSLQLRDASGHGLVLSVLRYELPDLDPSAPGHGWDANWLVVDATLTGDAGAHHLTGPCLLTSETRALADWLHAVADGRGTAGIGFVEPLLSFRLGRQAGGTAQLGVRLGDAVADLVVPSRSLHAAADAWAAHLEDFPER